MKLLNFLVLFFTCTQIALGNPLTACQEKNPKWFQCEKDNDCKVIMNPCGQKKAAANLKFEKVAQDCNIHEGAAISCPEIQQVEILRAVCKNKICSVEK